MYQVFYKCRLCGEEIKGSSGIYPSYHGSVPQMNVNNNIEYFPKTEIHDCKDGSMGVMDFQGFKKWGIEEQVYHDLCELEKDGDL